MLSFIVFILAAQLFIIGTYPLYAAEEQVPDDLSSRRSVARVYGCAETIVGASLLAKNDNDNAFILDDRGALAFFASKLAPTVLGIT
jgi:hypothetical protein